MQSHGSVLLGLLSCVLCWAAPLSAQVCSGFASLADARYRVGLNASSHTYASAAGVSLTAGRVVFGTVGAVRASDRELGLVAYDLGVEVGADVQTLRRPIMFCPVVAASFSEQPRDRVVLIGTGYRRVTAEAGIGIAGVVWRDRRLAVLPTAGIRMAHIWAREHYSVGYHRDADTYFLLAGGVGLVIRDRLTIRPGFSVPFGLKPPGVDGDYAVPFGREERELSLNLGLGLNFGRRQQKR